MYYDWGMESRILHSRRHVRTPYFTSTFLEYVSLWNVNLKSRLNSEA